MCVFDTLRAHLWLVIGRMNSRLDNHLDEQWQGAIVIVWQDNALMAAATHWDAASIGFPRQGAGLLQAPWLLECS